MAASPKPVQQLSPIERIRLARRVNIEVAGPKSLSLRSIAKREGLHEATLRMILKKYSDDGALQEDGVEAVEETLHLYTSMIEVLCEVAAFGPNDSARVAAARSVIDAAKGRLELMAALGRLPRRLTGGDEHQRMIEVIDRMMAVIQRHKLSSEVLMELMGVLNEIEGSAVEVAELVEAP